MNGRLHSLAVGADDVALVIVESPRRSVPPALAVLVAVYFLITGAILARWHSEDWFPVTGDEPHYLVMADSVVHDHTFDLTDSYVREFAERNIYPGGLAPEGTLPTPANSHVIEGEHGRFSVHNVGLPVLLSPGWALAGIAGAKGTMIVISALAALVVGWLAFTLIGDRRRAMMAAAAVVLSMPLIAGAGQIYPDLPSGVISLVVLTVALATPATRSRTLDYVATAMAAFQPWLQIKFAPAALIAISALVWSHMRGGDRRRAIGLVAIFVASMSLLATYNSYAFGRLGGPYGEGSLQFSKQALTVFFGLHIDRSQGILIQNPLLAVGCFELIRGIRRGAHWAFFVALTYLSLIVPNALHPNWYGGRSFAGRFGWSAALVLMLPAIVGLARLSAHSARAFAAVVALALSLQACFLWEIVHRRFDLYNQGDIIWISDYRSLYRGFGRLLPAFYNADWAFRYTPNRVALLSLATLIVAAWVGFRPTVRLALATLGALYVFAALSLRTIDPDLFFPAFALPANTGHLESPVRMAGEGDQPGLLLYGPGISLEPGVYGFTIEYRSRDASTPAAAWDVLFPESGVLAQHGALPDTKGDVAFYSNVFYVPGNRESTRVDVRMIYNGSGSAEARSLVLKKFSS